MGRKGTCRMTWYVLQSLWLPVADVDAILEQNTGPVALILTLCIAICCWNPSSVYSQLDGTMLETPVHGSRTDEHQPAIAEVEDRQYEVDG